jgi:hypothetical protein
MDQSSFMNVALFIKRAEESQTKEFIINTFKNSNIGIVKEVTFIKKTSIGTPYNGVVVIFKKWNMNKYVEKLFNQMSESRDGTTRFYFEQKRYWIVNVHKQQLPECEETVIVNALLPDKERIDQLEMLVKSMSSQIFYAQARNEKNERRMMEYEQKDVQKNLTNIELQFQVELKNIERKIMEQEHKEEIQKLKDENLRMQARCSLLETDKEMKQKEITLFREEVNDLNNIINYIEYVTPSNLVY